METLEKLLPHTNSFMEKSSDTNANYALDLVEGKKESIDGARVSAETVLKDNRLKETIGRMLGGILGILVLFGSITNVIQDFKTRKRSPWVYSRIILDFVASGVLIGYALEQTLFGLLSGLTVGIIILLCELKFK
jgi:hypothetical protein